MHDKALSVWCSFAFAQSCYLHFFFLFMLHFTHSRHHVSLGYHLLCFIHVLFMSIRPILQWSQYIEGCYFPSIRSHIHIIFYTEADLQAYLIVLVSPLSKQYIRLFLYLSVC